MTKSLRPLLEIKNCIILCRSSSAPASSSHSRLRPESAAPNWNSALKMAQQKSIMWVPLFLFHKIRLAYPLFKELLQSISEEERRFEFYGLYFDGSWDNKTGRCRSRRQEFWSERWLVSSDKWCYLEERRKVCCCLILIPPGIAYRSVFSERRTWHWRRRSRKWQLRRKGIQSDGALLAYLHSWCAPCNQVTARIIIFCRF